MRAIIETVEKLYPSVASFEIDGGIYKGYDKDGKQISIDKAAVDTEHAKENYKDARIGLYPSLKILQMQCIGTVREIRLN